MKRRLILIHDKRPAHQDRGWAYEVPESSAFDTDCDLNALLAVILNEVELDKESKTVVRRGPFFYCCKCNGIFLEWDTMPGRVISGMAERVDEGQACGNCWHAIKYGLPIAPVGSDCA